MNKYYQEKINYCMQNKFSKQMLFEYNTNKKIKKKSQPWFDQKCRMFKNKLRKVVRSFKKLEIVNQIRSDY